jgi:phage-related holin
VTAQVVASRAVLSSTELVSYIFSLLNFVIDNTTLFKTNSEVYDVNTRGRNNFYLSQPRLSTYKNGVYMGLKVFNHLPSFIKDLSDNKNQLKNTSNNYLLLNSFYSLNDFLTVNRHFKVGL